MGDVLPDTPKGPCLVGSPILDRIWILTRMNHALIEGPPAFAALHTKPPQFPPSWPIQFKQSEVKSSTKTVLASETTRLHQRRTQPPTQPPLTERAVTLGRPRPESRSRSSRRTSPAAPGSFGSGPGQNAPFGQREPGVVGMRMEWSGLTSFSACMAERSRSSIVRSSINCAWFTDEQ